MEELVEKAIVGDKEAFAEATNMIDGYLHKVAYKFLNDKNNLDDAVQETLVKAYENISKLKNQKFFKTWITRILINVCKDINKKEKKRIDLEEKLQIPSDVLEDDLFKDIEKSNFENNEILEKLSDDEREIVTLYYAKKLTTEKISKKLNMNENTIKSHLYRARKKLSKNKKKTLSALTTFVLVLLLVSSGITFGGRIIETLKEKITIFQVTFSSAIEEAKEDNFMQKIESQMVYSNNIGIKPDIITMDDKILYISYLIDIKGDIKDFELESYSIYDNEDNLLSVGLASNISKTSSKDYSSNGIVYSTKPSKLEDGNWYCGTTSEVIYNKDYPLSKKLKISIDKISVIIGNERKTFDGNWNFEIDLEDKFNDRTSTKYKYKPNDKIKNIEATLNDLSFELEIEFNEKINSNVVNMNNIILENDAGEVVGCYLKIVNQCQNKVTYICDIGKYSENIDTLHFYMKYGNGYEKYVDVTLEK